MTIRSPLKDQPDLRVVRAKRVYEQIAEQIGEMIRSERYRPGDRIPPERDLARMLGVSRPSVREAMIALEASGLIEVRVGDGTYVREPVPAGGAVMPWDMGVDPGPGPFEQFQARRLIETDVAARAAVSASSQEIRELEDLVAEMEEVYPSLGDFEDKLGFRFHTALARAARNGILANVVENLWTLRESEMWRHLRRRVVNPDNRRQAVIDRREIVAGIAERNPSRARAAMVALLDRAERRYFGPEEDDPAR